MTDKRKIEILDALISWIIMHDEEFIECAIEAADMTLEEAKELDLIEDDYEYEERHFGVLVYKYKEGDNTEYTDEYEDIDDMRADYIWMLEHNKEDYEYIVMQDVTIDKDGEEHIEELDKYFGWL